MQPHYFRGFSQVNQPVALDGDLIVIDGRNSSGKTSLAEALEWLFTGALSRREQGQLGNPRELENCIGNQFRPEEEETWVSAVFTKQIEQMEQRFSLKRVLRQDYGTTSTSKCESELYIDDRALTPADERQVMDELFASVPPLLMQHTLRVFVESTPDERRRYFERLLRLDELTYLISKAVVGDTRLSDFQSPLSDEGLSVWNSLSAMLKDDRAKLIVSRISRNNAKDLVQVVQEALSDIAQYEFGDQVDSKVSLSLIKDSVAREQRRARQRSFPLITKLRQQRQIPDELQAQDVTAALEKEVQAIRQAWVAYLPAKEAALSVGHERGEIAKAVRLLEDAHLIDRSLEHQLCPICAYQDSATLSTERLTEVNGWGPALQHEGTTRNEVLKHMNALVTSLKNALDEHDGLLPVFPLEAEIDKALAAVDDEPLKEAVSQLRSVRSAITDLNALELKEARELLEEPVVIPGDDSALNTFIERYVRILESFKGVPDQARRYQQSLIGVETSVAAIASEDPKYRLREGWLACTEKLADIAADIRWEKAKRQTQKDLVDIRAQLLAYRVSFLERRRSLFNDGMQEVWATLRKEQYMAFSRLNIPSPRGRGLPIEIEVKAILDNGNTQVEIDALRVFSESQVNALGIAAFITRSRLLGHGMLIFDDPVQSMDEEHFRTFASDVLQHVLSQGFQVILLTHNDTFARDVSYWHYNNPGLCDYERETFTS